MKKTFKRYVFNGTSLSSFILTFAIGVAICVTMFYFDSTNNKEHLTTYSHSVGFSLYENINYYVDDLALLDAYLVETDGEITDSFETVAKKICNNNNSISAICLAPNGVVRAIYPIKNNEYLRGSDYNSDGDSNIVARTAIRNGDVYLAGPYKTIKGEEVISLRLPIYTDGMYWGIASITLKFPQCLGDNLTILKELENNKYIYQITREKSENNTVQTLLASENYNSKYENNNLLSVSYDQEILGSKWTVTICRDKIWYSEWNLYFAIFLTLGLSCLVSFFYTKYRLNISDKVSLKLAEQEALIAEKDQKVTQGKGIIEILASEYAALYVINLDTDEFETYALSPYMKEKFGDAFAQLHNYEPAIKVYVEKFVKNEAKERMLEITDKSNVFAELSNKKSFTTTFINKQERYCEMKFVKTEDTNDKPHIVALGFADKHDEILRDKNVKEQMQLAKEAAEHASNAKSLFLFNMSHDIRTPMNAIIGFANMALKHLDDQECVEDSLTKVQASSKHLLSLINDILDMSRIESGNIEIDDDPVDVYVAAQKLFDLNNANAIDKSIDFTMNINVEHSFVYSDELRISRVLTNIIGNAIKYTKPGGKVDFSINEVPCNKVGYNGYDFIIADTGIGISEEYIDHIFESFTREKTSTISGVQGTGLGMTITKQLVDLMQGTIDIKSKVSVGTTVTVHFDLKECISSIEQVEKQSFDNSKLSGKRVLLVEDNELNREIAHDILEDEEMIIEEATDGAEAVKMIQKANDAHYYDFVLMDIQMPYMDGYQATREIRTMMIPDIDKMPIIAMTANAFAEDKQKAMEAGMNAHVAKPIDVPTLIDTLNSFI